MLFRAVVWTDTLQFSVMIGAVLTDPFGGISVWTVSVVMTWMCLANIGVNVSGKKMSGKCRSYSRVYSTFISIPTFAEAKRFCFQSHHFHDEQLFL